MRIKGKRLNVTFTPALYEKIQSLATEETKSDSAMVVTLVEEALKNREEKTQ